MLNGVYNFPSRLTHHLRIGGHGSEQGRLLGDVIDWLTDVGESVRTGRTEGGDWSSRDSPARLLAITLVTIFVAEGLIMLGLQFLPPVPTWTEAAIDATLLVIAVFPILFVTTLRPLSNSMDALEARNREMERYRRLVETVPVGVYRHTPGPDGEFEAVNGAMVDIFDADSRAALLDRPVGDLYVDPEQRTAVHEELLAEGEVSHREVDLETLDGEEIVASISAVAHETGDGVSFEGIVDDVTERIEYERRLEDQREKLELLNRIVRHDIRNDMSVILGMSEVLEDHVDAAGEEYVRKLQQRTDSTVELTKVLRDLMAVMVDGEGELEPVDAGAILESEAAELADAFEDVTVTVEDLPSTRVCANEMLSSVFRNVLRNAVEHNPGDDPRVRIDTETTPEAVRIRIADNGPGIDDERRAAVFGRGEKGLESAGTGVGLYLVDNLVDAFDGRVWIEEPAPAGAIDRHTQVEDWTGTAFVIELERAD